MTKASTSESVDYLRVPPPPWRIIKRCLPTTEKHKGRGRPRIDDRAVINGIWYLLWTGCQWKAVHRDWFGASSSVLHQRFQTRQKLDVFERIMRKLAKYYAKERNIKWKWQAIDSKACPAPSGSEDTGRNPTDRGKQGTKIHLLVDRRGAPLAVFITGASRHDEAAAVGVIISVVVERPEKEQHLCADKAYDAADFREFLTLEGITPHIKHNPRGSKNPEPSRAGLGECTHPANVGWWSGPCPGW